MNNTNIYKEIVENRAWCFSHVRGKVSRKQKDATSWSGRCSRGWDLWKHPELQLQNEEYECQILIEKAGDTNE